MWVALNLVVGKLKIRGDFTKCGCLGETDHNDPRQNDSESSVHFYFFVQRNEGGILPGKDMGTQRCHLDNGQDDFR